MKDNRKDKKTPPPTQPARPASSTPSVPPAVPPLPCAPYSAPVSAPPLRVLIVDDEPPARERARYLLSKIGGVEIVGDAANGNEALRRIDEYQPDLVLLDIQMPELDGLRMIEALDDPPAIVFSTAYDHHAVRAFDLEAVDYLLKPYSAQRLARALDRARRFLGGADGSPDSGSCPASPPLSPRRVPALDGLATTLVPPEEIVLLRISEGVVFLFREEGDSLICSQTLGELEEWLPSGLFFRASRKALFNLEKVLSVAPTLQGGVCVSLRGGETEQVSRRRARHLNARLSIG